jgi:hypothetical protein
VKDPLVTKLLLIISSALVLTGCKDANERELFFARSPDTVGRFELVPAGVEFVDFECYVHGQGVQGFLDGVDMRRTDPDRLMHYLVQVEEKTSLEYRLGEDLDRILAKGGELQWFEYRRANVSVSGLLVLRKGEVVYGDPNGATK